MLAASARVYMRSEASLKARETRAMLAPICQWSYSRQELARPGGLVGTACWYNQIGESLTTLVVPQQAGLV